MTVKILLPHDGTKMSDKAFKKSVELAIALKAEITLLHVVEEIPIPPTLILGNDSTLINRSRRNIGKQLERGWNKLAELKAHEIESTDVKMNDVCLYGHAADQILRFAKNNKIDMIIMASRRFAGISKIKVLGSVTRKVSELADCPVLIIH